MFIAFDFLDFELLRFEIYDVEYELGLFELSLLYGFC